MATHTQLPIYKAAYDLLDVSIGEKITNECIEITIASAAVPKLDIEKFDALTKKHAQALATASAPTGTKGGAL